MTQRADLTGRDFGRLIAVRRAPNGTTPNGRRHARWECLCDPSRGGCGRSHVANADALRRGHTRSCGCFARENSIARHTTHGASAKGTRSLEYQTWASMISRCERPRATNFAHYGGRGIVVCRRWRESFTAFLADMGPRPTPAHSIDRIDNDGHYEPSNCRWASRVEQASNRGHKATGGAA